MDFDIDQAIKECEAKKSENEVVAFAVGAGRIIPIAGKKKKMKKAMDFIKDMDGFLGVHPTDLWHTLIIFDSLNNAKIGRNLMHSKGIQTGKFICPILIGKEFLNNDRQENT